MVINLRSANALQLAITQAINNIKVNPTVTISRFDKPTAKFDAAKAELHLAIEKKFLLIDVLHQVRNAIARVGTEAGVSDLLGEMAKIDKKIEAIKSVASVTEFAPTHEILLRQHRDMVDEPHGQNMYHSRRNEIVVSTIEENIGFDKTLATLRVGKQQLSDRLLATNLGETISISPELVQVLQDNGLI